MRSLHGIGSVFQTVLFRLQLAESLFELGELDRAESHLDSAFAHLKAHGEMWLAPEVHRVRLMLLRAQAAPDEVLRHPIGIGLDLAAAKGRDCSKSVSQLAWRACGATGERKIEPARFLTRSMAGSPRASTPPI
jgi:hypothetical protein